MRGVVTALLLCSLSSALPVQAQRADSVIERSSAAYRQLRSLTAEFDQVISNEMIGTYKSRGALAQAGAARLSMRFTDPAGEKTLHEVYKSLEKFGFYRASRAPAMAR